MRLGLGQAVQVEPGIDRVVAAAQLEPGTAVEIDRPDGSSAPRRRRHGAGIGAGGCAAGCRSGGGGTTVTTVAGGRRRHSASQRCRVAHGVVPERQLLGREAALAPHPIGRSGLEMLDDQDQQPPRAVRAELELLGDVGGARRAGDEVDRARHARRAWRAPIPSASS